MATNEVSIDIVARNGATPELARVRNDLTSLERSLGGVTREAKYLSDASDSSRGLGRHFTALSSTIASQLNPALGQTGAFLSILGREGDRVSLTLKAGAVAAVVGVAAFVEYNKVLTETIARHVEIQRVLAASDVGGATALLTKSIVDLRVQTEHLSAEPVKRFIADTLTAVEGAVKSAGIRGLLERLLGTGPNVRNALDRLLGEQSAGALPQPANLLRSVFGTTNQERAATEAQSAFIQVLPNEVAQRVLKATQDIAAAKQTAAHVELALAQETLNLNLAYSAQAASLADLKTKQDAATEALLLTQKNERGALAFNFPTGVPEATQQALDSAQLVERQALAAKQLTEEEITTKALSDAIRGIDLERLTIIRDTVRAQGEFVINAALGIKYGEESLANLDALIARGKSRGSVEKQTLELLQLQGQEITKQQERLGIRGDILAAGLQRGAIGGNALTQNTVAIAVAETNRQTQLSQAALLQNPTDRALAIEKANALTDTAIAKLRFDQSAKDSPLVGLQQGFQGVVDDFTATGTILRDGIRELGTDMSRTFSDTFTSVVMGDFKKLADLPRAFAANVIKAFSDALGKAVVGNIFESFAGSLGLGSGSVVRGLGILGGGLSAAGPAAAGGGALVVVGGQAFQAVAAGGGQTVLVPAGMGGGSASVAAVTSPITGVGTPASGSGLLSLFGSAGDAVKAFLNTPLSSVAPSLFGSSGVGTAASFGSAADAAAAMGGSAADVASIAGGAGATIGSAIGGAAAAVGLAFTIYQGLTNPPTAANITTGAVSGALSGALLGATVGSVFPGVGTLVGAAVGAIAGGALGGGAASLGKPDPAAKRARQQAEISRVTGAAGSMINEIGTAQTLEDLYAILTSWSSGSIGGTHGVAVFSTIFGPGHPAQGSAVGLFHPSANPQPATLEDLANVAMDPSSLRVSVQAGISTDVLGGTNAQVASAIVNQVKRIQATLGQIRVSTNDIIASPFGGNLLRTTTVPGTLARQLAGQQLNIEGPSLAGLDEATQVALLKNLAKLDQDLALGIIYRDPATDEIVSISTIGSNGMAVVQ